MPTASRGEGNPGGKVETGLSAWVPFPRIAWRRCSPGMTGWHSPRLFQPLGFRKLAQRHGALERGDVVDEKHAFEMIHLVLQAGGEKPVRFQHLRLAVAVEILRPDARGAVDARP